MKKVSNENNLRPILIGTRTISVMQLLLALTYVLIVIKAQSYNSGLEMLAALAPFYLFILLGSINLVLFIVYVIRARKSRLSIDLVTGSLFTLIVLVALLYVPVLEPILFS